MNMAWKKHAALLLCMLLLIQTLFAGCASLPAASPQEEQAADVPETILWFNATHAVLTELNGWDYNLFGGMEATEENRETMIPFLDEWWGVTDREREI